MRRSLVRSLAIAGAAASLLGCEDGPNQTYNPAPAGAGNVWNNGGSDAATSDPGAQDFDAGGGGTNSVNICTAAEQTLAWSAAFNAPIIPPFSMGGLDLSTGGTFAPFTIEMAQKGVTGTGFQSPKVCQGASFGQCTDGTGNPAYAWGPSAQLSTCYDIATHQLTFFFLQPGYDGELKFTLPATFNGVPVPAAKDASGNATDLNYVWHVGKPITENGQTMNIWKKSGGATAAAANKLYLGLMYTFQRALIALTDKTANPPLNELTDPAYSCLKAGKCRTSSNPDGSGGNFGARPVGVYFDAAQSNNTDPATAGSPSDIYMYPVKFEPYSLAPYDLSLDTYVGPNADPSLKYNGAPIYGPYSPAGVLGAGLPFCTLYMGGAWGDFLKNCVNVTGDSKIDGLSLAKLLGGQHHTAEWYTFSVVGTNQNFAADTAELTDQAGEPTVLNDTQGTVASPLHDDDVATDFYVDVRSSGAQLNDRVGNDATKGSDYHGTNAIIGYYRQLVLDDIYQQMKAYGITPAVDPTTCWLNGANPATWVPPKGCSGFEQLSSGSDPTGATPAPWTDLLDLSDFIQGGIFRPGDPLINFVGDPKGYDTNTGGGGVQNYFIQTQNVVQASLQQVVAILGRGNINNVPPAARDWRYYFRFWAQAHVKLFLNRSKDPTWHDLAGDKYATKLGLRTPDSDSLFFDLNNGIDKFEYVDRSQALRLGAPVDVEYNMLITSSNLQNINFYQRLTRAESALYQSMLTTKTDPPGSNKNVFVSDLFGSPAITNAGLFAPAADATGNPIPGKDAYYCATTLPKDPACPAGPPTDSAGKVLVDGAGLPLFTNYRGLTATSPYKIGSQFPIVKTKPYIASAIVALPNYANPYDQTTTNTPINVLVPWLIPQASVGFEVPINAQRAQFIQTGALDFSGVTITMNVDYLPVTDKNGNQFAKIAAVETQDFLGEVFPCVDPTSGDILRVRMYTSMNEVLSWFDNHPGSRTACNIYVRYSPYNNYPDYVVSLVNGVLLGVNPGTSAGPGRVADVTLFDPTLLTQTQ